MSRLVLTLVSALLGRLLKGKTGALVAMLLIQLLRKKLKSTK